MLYPWNEALETGHARMDEQHRGLVALFNDLADSVSAGMVQEKAGRVLSSLSLYVVVHFSMEEGLMAGYPGEAEHRDAHAFMREEVEMLVDRFKAGTLEANDVMDLLQAWIDLHILTRDKALADFMAARDTAGMASLVL